ncbi:sensor histidine kinase [Mesobacillus harenae]|uniref:ATP-binding protein n=1 Tax=Mesobacillus harenae TaxID=2213203 RepID=UPI001580E436|nr:sensor histidine kinase [Mesobacillus harenae]
MSLLSGLLINLLAILITVLIGNMLLLNKSRFLRISYRKLELFLVPAFLIIISLLLAVPVGNHGFIYDLRFIPFLLAGLYGGKRVTIALSFLLIVSRFLLGGSGVWVSLLLILLSSTGIIWLSYRYFQKPLHVKVTVVTASAFVYSIIGFLIPSLVFGFNDYSSFFIYSLVLTTSAFFVTYLLEVLRTAYILQLESIKFEKMEIVSHLAASISHEVRNPLTAVKGFLQLIHENPKTSEESKAYASFAIEETSRATGIIDDYLTFAKPHSEEETAMCLESEIKKCVEILSPLALKQGVELESLLLHNSRIHGDPHKFQQVLINIGKNSIEAMPSGGVISIVTSEAEGKVNIRITDTGIGMSPQHIARLGEPYFSLKEQKGTGLGMMVVFRIVDSMRGTVKVTSEYKVGTSITLTFPAIT